jgi:hypothetical protein
MQPYRPGNGTEGDSFICQWCAKCARDADEDDPCEILTNSMAFDIDDDEYPTEWVIDEDGPRCTAFTRDDSDGPHRIEDKRQAEMFQ